MIFGLLEPLEDGRQDKKKGDLHMETYFWSFKKHFFWFADEFF